MGWDEVLEVVFMVVLIVVMVVGVLPFGLMTAVIKISMRTCD